MSFLSNLLLVFFYFSLFTFTHATIFEIQNKCPYTVWAAAIPGGGRQLNNGESWTINLNSSTTTAHFWGRTNCTFDVNGRGNCQTGDCNGLLECTTGHGAPPNTLAEYAQLNNLGFFDISLVDGFNIPMDFSGCRSIKCIADINGQCPDELRVPGGCNSPCNVFQTNEYCCYTGNCEPTNFSRFFKDRCPDAFSFPNNDGGASTFTCPLGTNYRIVFCP